MEKFMPAVTILGRGPDWTQAMLRPGLELWGTLTCLLVPGLAHQQFNKLFGFDGVNFPEIAEAVRIAKERQIPIVSNLEYATEAYPSREIVKRFRSGYMENSISHMIAYALYHGYQKIRIHGIGGPDRWDYQRSRTYIWYWLGVATGMGVDWGVGHGSSKWLYHFPKEFYMKPTAEQLISWHPKQEASCAV